MSVSHQNKFVSNENENELELEAAGSHDAGIKVNEPAMAVGTQAENSVSDTDASVFHGLLFRNDLIVSESDKKEYRHLVLDNGLRVLLIHEPEGLGGIGHQGRSAGHRRGSRGVSSGSDEGRDASDGEDDFADDETGDDSSEDADTGTESSARRSAAALCIGSGCADEGDSLPGLAHWLEHMVFMGSAKYPQENDFDAYVSERGGDTNAWTDMEQTLFHFDCRQECFPDCLDRFANFFVDPLLSADSLEREVEAVHSEFEEGCCSLQSQFEYYVGARLTSPGHPLSGFKWGNRRSLWELPRANGVDVRAKLREFQTAHYRASNMTAALQSRLSLDALEAAARSAFAGIPAGPRVVRPEQPLAAPFDSSLFGGRVHCLLPVKQVDRLRVIWPGPPARGAHLEQPHRLIGFCLAHEGPGSLADCLRREGLAVELEAGVHSGSGLSDNAWVTLMELTVKLTPRGLLEWRRVVRLTHAYVGMLGGNLPQLRRVYDELRSVERAAFRFAEESEPADSAAAVCVNMHRLPKPLWLLGDQRLPHRFDPAALRRYWECLQPGNACVLLASRSFEAACDNATEWFEMRYSELAPDPASLEDWKLCVTMPNPQLLTDCQLHMPPPNPFIPEHYDVTPPETVYREIGMASLPQYPIRLKLDNEKADKFALLYYFKDRKFATPRAVVRVKLESPVICESVKSSTLARVWLYMLNFQLHRDAYAAQEANLSYDVVLIEPFSILVDLEGFNDKLFVLYSTILDKWNQLGGMLSARDPTLKFESAREEVRKTLANQLFSAKRFASNVRHYLLERDRHLYSDQLACLESVTLDDMVDFHQRLLLRAFFRVYVHGNYGPEDAKNYLRRTLELLPPDSEVADMQNSCACLPLGRGGVRLLNMRCGDVNSVLVEEAQFQHPPTLRDLVLADVLMHIMWEPCFDFLRTKHQLGYSVHCGASRRHGCLSFHVTVASQASKTATNRVQAMVDKFALHFEKHLRCLKRPQFANYVRAVTELKLAEDSAMIDEVERYWAEIEDGGFMFDRRAKEAQLLDQLCMEELAPFYDRAVSCARRSFSFQIEGSVKKAVHEGGTAGYSLPLIYSTTIPAKQRLSPTDCPAAPGPVAYTKDVKALKAALCFLPARPVLE